MPARMAASFGWTVEAAPSSRLRSASRSERSCSASVSATPLPSLRDCAERRGQLVERLDVRRGRDVAQRGVQVGAGAVRGDGAADLAGQQVRPGRCLVERVGHVGDRVLEAVLRGERADEREEVGQLARDLGLARLRPGAEVLGREDVADEGERQGEEQRAPRTAA